MQVHILPTEISSSISSFPSELDQMVALSDCKSPLCNI